MKAEIISIGTELLLGRIVNTNAAYLSRRLAELGIDVFYQTTVGDNRHRLQESLERSIQRANIIIMTGGLGPTVDDITTETLASFTRKKLILEKSVLKDIRSHFADRALPMPRAGARQAYIPEGAHWMKNEAGTAPGLILEYRGALVIALPGPPRELTWIFENAVIPYLKKMTKAAWTIRSRTVRITGLVESQVHQRVKKLLELGPNPTVGIYALPGEVDLTITAKASSDREARRSIAKIEAVIRRRFGQYVFGCDDETLEGAVGAVLAKKRKTIAIAESCTGGLVSHRITNISGSSAYFLMGILAYSNGAKTALLGVTEDSIKRDGAVSRRVALEMARGIRNVSSADLGIGITGIAGPTGATRAKSLGLVYIALASRTKNLIREFRFKGNRSEVKFQASQAALDMVRRNA